MNEFHVVSVFIADDPYAFPVLQWVSHPLLIISLLITSELTSTLL